MENNDPVMDALRRGGMAIPWFTVAEWARARSLMPDAHVLGASHAEFERNLRLHEERARLQGVPTVRVAIALDEFIAWCRVEARQVNRQSCSQFAAHIAEQRDQGHRRR